MNHITNNRRRQQKSVYQMREKGQWGSYPKGINPWLTINACLSKACFKTC